MDKQTVKALTTKILEIEIIDKIEHIVTVEPIHKEELSVTIAPLRPGPISNIYYNSERNAIEISRFRKVRMSAIRQTVPTAIESMLLSDPNCFQQLETTLRNLYNEPIATKDC